MADHERSGDRRKGERRLVAGLVDALVREASDFFKPAAHGAAVGDGVAADAEAEGAALFRKSLDLPEPDALSYKQLEDLCDGLRFGLPSKRADIEYFIPRRQLRVTVYAAGFQHASAVVDMATNFNITMRHNGMNRPVAVMSGGLTKVGDTIHAPDIVVFSGYPIGGPEPGRGGRPVTFVGEVERDNRNLPELVDHLARVTDVGSVNGVLGVKHWGADRRAVLFILRKRRDLAGHPLEVMHAHDFGLQPMDANDLAAADARMQQRFGVAPAQWTRAPNGVLHGQEVVVEIPFDVVADGVLDAAGAAPLGLAAELAARPALGGDWVPVRINLAGLLFKLSV